MTKTVTVTDNGDGYTGSGDVANYTITVENKGNVTLSSLTVTDSLTDANGVSLVMSNGPFFSGSTQGSSAGTLLAGEKATYRAYYIISDAAAATGLISNIATATASSPDKQTMLVIPQMMETIAMVTQPMIQLKFQ